MPCGEADLVFTDPLYNVAIDGNLCGHGSVKHREFAFASGEMSNDQFTAFLADTLGNIACVMRDGAIAYVGMDWRHRGELLAAGSQCFTELKNLVVWNKTNGGMGAFYRSNHELIFVFKQGTARHTNSFGPGGTGRYRTNVWDNAKSNCCLWVIPAGSLPRRGVRRGLGCCTWPIGNGIVWPTNQLAG